MTLAHRQDVQLLYQTPEKIYPRSVYGRFGRLRSVAAFVLLGLFYGVAWLRTDGEQLLLFDLPSRKFHVFGLTLFPQDFVLLTLLLIVATLSLFFFTALAGRLWCGYACPQTVWSEVFLRLEELVEGDRRHRMKLDKAAWDVPKVLLKSAKHGLWLTLSVWTGFTFVGYFTPITDLAARLVSVSWGPWETFWVLFYGLVTYVNAGWLREQVCTYMCPYARFQGAMFDSDTLIISYQKERGEPRGARRRGEDNRPAGKGDCIDCTLCVQVCPTGIDIRDGLQYQCIACAACIDVCDQVMDKMGYPRGLIAYTTQNTTRGTPNSWLRPRLFIYAGILLFVGAIFSTLLYSRIPFELDVMRDRNVLFREISDNRVENVYVLRLVNKDTEAHEFALSVQGERDIALVVDAAALTVAAGEVGSVDIRIQIPADQLKQPNTPIVFSLQSKSKPQFRVSTETRFLGP